MPMAGHIFSEKRAEGKVKQKCQALTFAAEGLAAPLPLNGAVYTVRRTIFTRKTTS